MPDVHIWMQGFTASSMKLNADNASDPINIIGAPTVDSKGEKFRLEAILKYVQTPNTYTLVTQGNVSGFVLYHNNCLDSIIFYPD